MSTGRSSIESKSIGWASRANRPRGWVSVAHAAVRDGDAAADAGRAQALALQQPVEQATFVELQHGSGAGRQLCQQSLLAGRFHAGQNGVRTGQQIGNFHNVTNRLADKGQNSPGARRRPYRRLVRPGQAAPSGDLDWPQSAGPVSACAAMAALGSADGRLRPMPSRPSRRRSADEGMRMASRYLATVRRAISMPSPFSKIDDAIVRQRLRRRSRRRPDGGCASAPIRTTRRRPECAPAATR